MPHPYPNPEPRESPPQRSTLSNGSNEAFSAQILRLAFGPGLAALIVLVLLGVFPGVRSPIDRIENKVEAHDQRLEEHLMSFSEPMLALVKETRVQNERLLKILRSMCRNQRPLADCD